jgi:hypothetical protein
MTVRELIAELQKHVESNPDAIVTWEGTVHELTTEHLYRGRHPRTGRQVLFIDADGCFYKQSFESPPAQAG